MPQKPKLERIKYETAQEFGLTHRQSSNDNAAGKEKTLKIRTKALTKKEPKNKDGKRF